MHCVGEDKQGRTTYMMALPMNIYTVCISYATDNKLINHSQCICREGVQARVEGGREGGHSTPRQRNSISYNNYYMH